MKKTQCIELLSTIRKTWISFISIIMFVALGVGMFLGLTWSGQGVTQGVRDFFDEYSFHNFDVSSANGLSEQDLQDIAAIPGVTTVEGGYSASTSFTLDGEGHAARVFSETKDVDKMRIIEGTAPQAANEAVIDSVFAEKHHVAVGDTITFETVSTNPLTGQELLHSGRYTITALGSLPTFVMSLSITRGTTDLTVGAADSFFVVPESAFVTAAYGNRFTNAYVLADVGEYTGFTAQTDASLEIENQIVELGKSNGPTDRGWTVLNRDENIGVGRTVTYQQGTDKLRFSMALVFVVVGLLVCYTAISRLVQEEAVNIGTKKALGFRSWEIITSYAIYSLIAVVLGIILSVGIAIFLQAITASSVKVHFTIPTIPICTTAADLLILTAVELACIELTTYIACHNILKKSALQLLRGDGSSAKTNRLIERSSLWNRMSLFSQSIVNNFFNEKARVVGTIISVAGSTALVVMACMLYFNLNDTFEKHFAEVYFFNTSITYEQGTDGAQQEIIRTLDSYGAESAPVLKQNMGLSPSSGPLEAAVVFVPEDQNQFLALHGIRSVAGGTGSLDDSGVWISQSYAERNDLSAGDTISLIDTTGTTRELTVAGAFEHWLPFNEIIMTPRFYQDTFGESATSNAILARIDDSSLDAVDHDLQGVPGFFNLENERATNKEIFDTSKSLTTTIVIMYLTLAIIMSFVVLMNLVVMCIQEKKHEIIVMRINGFSLRSVKAYISLDSIILTIAGILLGLVVGTICAYFAIVSIENGSVRYIHDPSILACIIGAALNALLAVVINLIAMRRISHFNMADINKS